MSTQDSGHGDVPANLYLDFWSNQEPNQHRSRGLEDQLADLKRRFENELFPDLRPEESLLEHFVANVFPNGIPQTYYFSNTCLKDGLIDVTIRPRAEGPRLSALFPRGLVLCIRAHPSPKNHPSPFLIVDRIVEVGASAARTFEVEREVTPRTRRDDPQSFTRPQNLGTLDFLKALPPISRETRTRLRDWYGFLAWKENYVRSRLAGLRYFDRELTEQDHIRFWFVVESENELAEFRRKARSTELNAFPLDYSLDPWKFKLNDRFRGRSIELGDFVGYSALEPANELARERLGEMPHETPLVGSADFRLDEDDRHELAARDDDDIEDARRQTLTRFPESGFLSISAAGDMSLVRRHGDALRQLEEQSGYAPFLSSYLFDVRAAQVPRAVVEIEHWRNRRLTEDQKAAVRCIVAAPDLSLIQGPPGTGKTTVIAEAAYQLARQGKKVLLASQANLAVDNALERLARDPHVRAIRLDEKVDASLPCAPENVLRTFYEGVAAQCAERTVDVWRRRDDLLGTLRRWLDRASAEHVSLLREESEHKRLTNELGVVTQELAKARSALDETRRRNDDVRVERGHLENFRRCLDGEEVECLVPEPMLDAFFDEVVRPLVPLRANGIDASPNWHRPRGGTRGERSGWARWTGRRLRRYLEILPTLSNDVARLGSASSSAEGRELHEEARRELERLTEMLEHDRGQLEAWQRAKTRERQLRQKAVDIDPSLYREIFNAIDGDTCTGERLARLDREEACKRIQSAIHALEVASKDAQAGLERVRTNIARSLESLREVREDDRPLRQVEALLNELTHRVEESRLRVASARETITTRVAEMRDRVPVAANAAGHYDGVRAAVASLLERETETQRSEATLRKAFQPVIESWIANLRDPVVAATDDAMIGADLRRACNVVGVTCNENPRTLSEAGYTHFDAVIVDEVSKATPVELLLPVMLGRTAALVGDHRQLPPLFKERGDSSTFVETVDQAEEAGDPASRLDRENLQRYEKLVTASLFKEHFENAPRELKAALFVQFRMHPQIMSIVNRFYEGKLRCGLERPDEERSHGVTLGRPQLPYVRPDQHAIWIDSSKDPRGAFHEERQEGTSKSNALEARLIGQIIADLDRACRALGWGAGTRGRKAVGVISFYGAQLRAIRRELEQLPGGRPTALDVEVNTVDRFQGKEKPIVLVSLVRNKRGRRSGENAFVAQFERINVAFSRAQELLVIVGAKDMFGDYPVRLPHVDRTGVERRCVYGEILKDLDADGRVFTSERVLPTSQGSASPPPSPPRGRRPR